MSLKIYVDLTASDAAMELLKSGVGDHELIIPKNPSSSVLSQGETDERFYTADIAFGQPDAAAVVKAKSLEWIQVSSSGITRYDTPEFRELVTQKKIAVCNSADVYAEPCAEHVLAFIMAQARQLPIALNSRPANGTDAWMDLRDCPPLQGQKVLILGYGAIGEKLAGLLAPLEMSVSAHRRQARGDEVVPIVPAEQLNAALGESDHVISILPASPSTKNFMNGDRFAAMKQGSVFYNIGRGTTVDQEALLDALKNKLKAAWLDVTEPEPLPEDHPLYAQANCFITPHTAGGHTAEDVSLVKHFLANLRRFEKGEPLVNRVM